MQVPTPNPSADHSLQSPVDLAQLMGLLARPLDEAGVRSLFLRLNQGKDPEAHILGDVSVGESRTYYFPNAGVTVCATDYSGAGQRIGIVTLAGKTRKVVRDGREYLFQPFRGVLPLSLKWGELRTDILKRLGGPMMSNEGIALSDRPKSPIQESRDADEFRDGMMIIRLIYSDPREDPGVLEEIDFQRVLVPKRP